MGGSFLWGGSHHGGCEGVALGRGGEHLGGREPPRLRATVLQQALRVSGLSALQTSGVRSMDRDSDVILSSHVCGRLPDRSLRQATLRG